MEDTTKSSKQISSELIDWQSLEQSLVAEYQITIFCKIIKTLFLIEACWQ